MSDELKYLLDRLRSLQSLLIILSLSLLSVVLVDVNTKSAALVMGEVAILENQSKRLYNEVVSYPPAEKWIEALDLSEVRREEWWEIASQQLAELLKGQIQHKTWLDSTSPLKLEIDRTWSGLSLARWPRIGSEMLKPDSMTVRQMLDYFERGSIQRIANNAGYTSKPIMARALLKESLSILDEQGVIEHALVTASAMDGVFDVTIGSRTREAFLLEIHSGDLITESVSEICSKTWNEKLADRAKIETWLALYNEDGDLKPEALGVALKKHDQQDTDSLELFGAKFGTSVALGFGPWLILGMLLAISANISSLMRLQKHEDTWSIMEIPSMITGTTLLEKFLTTGILIIIPSFAVSSAFVSSRGPSGAMYSLLLIGSVLCFLCAANVNYQLLRLWRCD